MKRNALLQHPVKILTKINWKTDSNKHLWKSLLVLVTARVPLILDWHRLVEVYIEAFVFCFCNR